jgi:lipopolysaccharide assembly outer membrane protein LptD (OstA)
LTNLFKILILCSFLFCVDNRLRIIQADLMQNHEVENQSVMELTGNVILQKNKLFLYTEKATNYPDLNIFKLSGPVTMVDSTDTMRCNNMIYFSDSLDYVLATGNVNFIKPNELIECDSLYYWTDIDSGYAIGNVKLNQEKRYISTDYIHYKETDGPKGISFSAYRNVNIIEAERIIQTDTLTYNDNSELMTLKNGGVIKEKTKGVLGDEILLQYKDSILSQIEIIGNAEAWQDFDSRIKENDPNFYRFRNEMKSKAMTVILENNEIEKIFLQNMAETIYHVSDDSLLIGTNHTSGDTIVMSFKESELKRIQVIGGGQGIFKPEIGNTKIDTSIVYKANYLDYFVDQEQTELIENAIVEYQDTKLIAGNILVNWRENILNALQYNENLPTVITGNTKPLTGDDMTFDLITKHGKINKGITEYNSGYYHGNKIYRDEPDIFHVKSSKYTSCELEKPHYYFASNKMKLVGNDRVIAKPLVLHIFDIPIIGIPFAVFPNKGGRRHSGWIMPAFGTRNSSGTFFQKLGYYFAPNDYVDVKTLFDFYDKLGLVVNSRFNYVKRYNYSGSISTRINQSLVGKDIIELSENFTRQFNLIWNHSQKFDPSQNLSINGHYVSNSDFYQSQWNDKANQLTQKIESKLNYSKRWSTWKNSLTLNMSDSYDLLAKVRKSENEYSYNHFLVERMQSLPNMSFSHGKSKLKVAGYDIPILNEIYWDYSSNLTNSIRKGWKFISNDSLNNSIWEDSTNVRSGVRHSTSFSTSNKFFGWLSISPRISFKENWVNQYTQLNSNYEKEYVNDFKRRLTWNTSLSMTQSYMDYFQFQLED